MTGDSGCTSPAPIEDGRKLVRLTLAVEGAFASIALIASYVFSIPLPVRTSPSTTVVGVCFALVIFALNCSFMLRGMKSQTVLRQVYEFNSRFVLPFAKNLSLRQSAIVSLAAGVGEELFFRGLLQPLVGVGISGLAFSVMHFGAHAKRYPIVLVLYFGISCGFGGIYHLTESLWSVIVAHTVYDLIILMFLRKYPTSFALEANLAAALGAETVQIAQAVCDDKK